MNLNPFSDPMKIDGIIRENSSSKCLPDSENSNEGIIFGFPERRPGINMIDQSHKRWSSQANRRSDR